MVLDIKLKEDNPGSDYTITINDDKIIHTTIASTSDKTLNQWLHEMYRIHCSKNDNSNFIVILSAAQIEPDGYMNCFRTYSEHPQVLVPDMLKLCVGSYCILLDVKKDKTPAPLGFILSSKITLVGFDIKRVVEKLGFMMKVEKMLDLNELMGKVLERKYYRMDQWWWHWYWDELDKMGRRMVGDQIDFKELIKVDWRNPKKIKYWEEDGNINNRKIYSQDNIKVSTVDVYLCHLIAVKCRDIICEKKISLDDDKP